MDDPPTARRAGNQSSRAGPCSGRMRTARARARPCRPGRDHLGRHFPGRLLCGTRSVTERPPSSSLSRPLLSHPSTACSPTASTSPGSSASRLRKAAGDTRIICDECRGLFEEIRSDEPPVPRRAPYQADDLSASLAPQASRQSELPAPGGHGGVGSGGSGVGMGGSGRGAGSGAGGTGSGGIGAGGVGSGTGGVVIPHRLPAARPVIPGSGCPKSTGPKWPGRRKVTGWTAR
jgi:hypothetical protein